MDTINNTVSARQMKILKMDTLRLNEYLNNVMLENPVIEIEENLTGYTDEDMRVRKTKWLESNDFEEGLGYFDKDTPIPPEPQPDEEMLNIKDGETLEQHLLRQLAEQALEPRILQAAQYLVGCLDENGYLLAQPQDLAEQGYTKEEADCALSVIQNLEPLGVGASSLKECLLLQLDEDDQVAKTLLNELDLIGSADTTQMAQRLGKTEQEIEQTMRRIRLLNPKPGSQYTSHDRSPYIVPDVVMIKFVNEFYVALSDFSFPQIKISEDYQNLLRRFQGEDSREEREYLEEKMADAAALQQEIAFRNKMLMEVSKVLIKLQEPFFRYGPRYMNLLPIQRLAEVLEMEPELVSATLKNKYLQSPFGVYPMKFFVAREHHPQQEGMQAIKQQLNKVIRSEHPDTPYTDEQLAQEMAHSGVFLTEEAIERLREEMNIPDSEHRIFYRPEDDCDDSCSCHHEEDCNCGADCDCSHKEDCGCDDCGCSHHHC